MTSDRTSARLPGRGPEIDGRRSLYYKLPRGLEIDTRRSPSLGLRRRPPGLLRLPPGRSSAAKVQGALNDASQVQVAAILQPSHETPALSDRETEPRTHQPVAAGGGSAGATQLADRTLRGLLNVRSPSGRRVWTAVHARRGAGCQEQARGVTQAGGRLPGRRAGGRAGRTCYAVDKRGASCQGAKQRPANLVDSRGVCRITVFPSVHSSGHSATALFPQADRPSRRGKIGRGRHDLDRPPNGVFLHTLAVNQLHAGHGWTGQGLAEH